MGKGMGKEKKKRESLIKQIGFHLTASSIIFPSQFLLSSCETTKCKSQEGE